MVAQQAQALPKALQLAQGEVRLRPHPTASNRSGAIRAGQRLHCQVRSGRFGGPTPQRRLAQRVTDDNQSSHYQRYGQPLAH